MSKRNYREPVKNTCPDIDDVIITLDTLRDIAFSDDVRAGDDALEAQIIESNRKLEQLRKCNEQLRDWGNDEANRVDESESENEELRNEIDELKREIERLNSQLERYDN